AGRVLIVAELKRCATGFIAAPTQHVRISCRIPAAARQYHSACYARAYCTEVIPYSHRSPTLSACRGCVNVPATIPPKRLLHRTTPGSPISHEDILRSSGNRTGPLEPVLCG